MNTQENDVNDLLAAKIAALLDEGTQRIDSNTANKLLAARKEALAHFKDAPVHALAQQSLAGGLGNLGNIGRLFEPFNHNLRAGFVVLALLAGLGGIVAWHTFGQQGNEIAEIDEALLTDELPINAYLENGFDSWVKRHTR